MSADGSTVAFHSLSDLLVEGDDNEREDVFVADVASGAIQRVNVGTDGSQAGLGGLPDARPSLSADGSLVAFTEKDRLTPDAELTSEGNVYVRHVAAGTTRFVDEGSAASISGDGKVVAYQQGGQVYASDGDGVQLVSRPAEGDRPDGAAETPDVNADGSQIAFASTASNLVAGDEGSANPGQDIFVRHRDVDRTELESRDDRSRPALGWFSAPSISADGGVVAFRADANPNGCADPALSTIVVRDVEHESTYSAVRALPGQLPDGHSGVFDGPSLAASGMFVGYPSYASNLVDGDDDGDGDGFVTELGALEDPDVFSPTHQVRAREADGTLEFELAICHRAGRRLSGELSYATEDGTAGSGSDYDGTNAGVVAFGDDASTVKVGVPIVADEEAERCETLFLRGREASAMLPTRVVGVIEGDGASVGPVFFERDGAIHSVRACGEPEEIADGREPAVAPDGDHLAFVRAGADGDELVVADTDGTDATVIASGPAGRLGRPAWSPDGKKIAIGEADGDPEVPHVQISLAAADGGGAAPVGDPVAFAGGTLSFSPDGERLALDRGRVGSPLTDIATLDVSSGALETITEGAAPSYGPDGSLVFVRGDVMWIRSPDGSERTFNPSRGTGEPSEFGHGRPAFSPDGTAVVFEREASGASWIDTAPVAGGPATVLTAPQVSHDRHPTWGPGPPVAAPAPTVSVADATAQEGSPLQFAVTLSSAAAAPVTVTATTSGGSAASGGDFTAVAGTVTFPAGTTSATFTVQTTSDALDEADETLSVTLTNPSGATIADGSATGTITDDDAPPSVTIGNASAVEGDAVGFPVSLSAASGRVVTVKLATTDGTATAPGDYTAQSNVTVTIPAGQTQVTASVPTTEDSVSEATETFSAAISQPGNATLGTPASATGTIDDDRPAASVGTPAAVDEGQPLRFPVTISRPNNVDSTVRLNTIDGTATAPGDYTARSFQDVTIPAGQTQAFFEVQTVDDPLVEGDETMQVEIRGGSNISLGSPTKATGTIRSTDLPAPAASVGTPAAVDEGQPLRFPVTISRALNVNASVRLNTIDGTATAPGDYTARSFQDVTIPAGQTQAFFEVQTVDDPLVEGDETMQVEIRGGSNISLGSPSKATGTIRSTDLPAPAVSVGPAAAVDEGTQLRFPITLSRANNVNSSVRLSTKDGTAKAGDDYTARTLQDVTIPAGQTTATFTVDTLKDSLTETDETVTVEIRGGSNVSLGSPSTATGTIRDPAPLYIVRGTRVGAETLAGTVTIKLPRTKVPLDLGGGAILPVGTIVDATAGTIELVSATATSKATLSAKTQRARFSGGIFTIRQKKKGSPLVTLALSGPELRRCPKAGVRRLQVDGKGDFAVQGRFATAASRSGRWLTEDRCGTTTVKVERGSAKVRDLVRKRTKTVRKGRSLTVRER